jgi:hypothetical protein
LLTIPFAGGCGVDRITPVRPLQADRRSGRTARGAGGVARLEVAVQLSRASRCSATACWA